MVQVILLNLFKQQFTSETNLSLSTLLNEFTTHAEPERERTRRPVLRKSQMTVHHQRVKFNFKVFVWHRELNTPSNQLNCRLFLDLVENEILKKIWNTILN